LSKNGTIIMAMKKSISYKITILAGILILTSISCFAGTQYRLEPKVGNIMFYRNVNMPFSGPTEETFFSTVEWVGRELIDGVLTWKVKESYHYAGNQVYEYWYTDDGYKCREFVNGDLKAVMNTFLPHLKTDFSDISERGEIEQTYNSVITSRILLPNSSLTASATMKLISIDNEPYNSNVGYFKDAIKIVRELTIEPVMIPYYDNKRINYISVREHIKIKTWKAPNIGTVKEVMEFDDWVHNGNTIKRGYITSRELINFQKGNFDLCPEDQHGVMVEKAADPEMVAKKDETPPAITAEVKESKPEAAAKEEAPPSTTIAAPKNDEFEEMNTDNTVN
jgi:hypothetical protein